MHKDSKLIDELGGTAKVANLLGLDKAGGGIQRVHNWRSRGIPAQVKVDRPDLFMPELIGTKGAPEVTTAEEVSHG